MNCWCRVTAFGELGPEAAPIYYDYGDALLRKVLFFYCCGSASVVSLSAVPFAPIIDSLDQPLHLLRHAAQYGQISLDALTQSIGNTTLYTHSVRTRYRQYKCRHTASQSVSQLDTPAAL